MYAIKITGTAIQCKSNAAITAIPTSINFGRLLLTERFLNFNAIMGTLLTINQDRKTIIPYNTHLFNKSEAMVSFSPCQ